MLLARASGGWSAPNESNAPTGAPKAQLYDMEKDRGERNNLYLSQPEVAQRLLKQLESDVERGRSTEGPAAKNDIENIVLWKGAGKSRKAGVRKKKNKKGK